MPIGKRVAISFDSYNPRRYSCPWIARVVALAVGRKPELQFGAYIGDDNGGEVEIIAYPGDILHYGQRDCQQLDKSINKWGVVEDDYSVRNIKQTEARALFEQRPKVEFTPSPAPTNAVVETRKPAKFTPSPVPENVFPERRKPSRFVQNSDGSWTVEKASGE